LNKIKQPTAIVCLSRNNGGMEIDSIKLAQKLSNHMQIILIARDNSFIESTRNEYLGVNNLLLETLSFHSNFGLSLILAARKIVKKYNVKNVIFFGASELKSLYFSFLNLDINLIVRHGTTKSKPKKDIFHQLIYSDVNYHVSICKHIEKNVQYIIPFTKNSKSILIYSSVDTPFINNIPHEKCTLLHIGRIAKAKGQTDAIEACQILVDNNIDFELNLVGDIDHGYKNEFIQFYNDCQYKDKINLVGFTNNVKSYIDPSDIFLFPSHGEGLSNAFLEALSNNLICLSYDNTSFPELQELGFHFHIIPDKNIDLLKINLLNAISNCEFEKKKSQNNNQLTKKIFSKNKEIQKYLEILI